MYGDKEESNSPYFLVNLAKKTFMKIDVPQEMHFDVEMYLAGAEKKLLLANETEAYIVDVSEIKFIYDSKCIILILIYRIP